MFVYVSPHCSYLGHLLGHESGGSILSALKQKLWANGLSAGTYLSNSDFACFTLTIELSDEGVKHTKEIAACVFAYIGMLQRAGPQEWVWLELKETADMNFRFINKTEPSSYATGLANAMHVYSIPHTVAGAHLHFECNLQETVEYLSYLRPNNAVISVAHKGFSGATQLKERWYGTEHNKRDFTAEEVQHWEQCLLPGGGGGEWEDKLFLPLPNPFIPTDFALRPKPLGGAADAADAATSVPAVAYPALVEKRVSAAAVLECLQEIERPAEAPVAASEPATDADGATSPPPPPSAEDEAAVAGEGEQGDAGEEDEEEEGEDEEDPSTAAAAASAVLPVLEGEHLLSWHLQDAVWEVPKLNVKVSLETLHACASPLNVALTELFTMCLKENLAEYSYYADCAGELGEFEVCVVDVI